jgi:ketosteroid isomerase-like protein
MTAVEVVGAYFKALSTGNFPEAFSHFSSDVTWSQPGNHQFSGVKTGAEQIGARLGMMAEYSEGSLVIEPAGEMMVSDTLIAAPIHFSAKKGNKSMDMSGVDLFEVVDGKITKVWLFSEDQKAEDSFWG